MTPQRRWRGFVLEDDVDERVASVIRDAGHVVSLAKEAGLGGPDAPTDEEVSVSADDRRLVVVAHDRDFAERRKRATIGWHLRLTCEQPDAPDVLRVHLERVVGLRDGTQLCVVEVGRERVSYFAPHWD